MISFESLPMPFKTLIATVFFLTMSVGICTCILMGKKQGVKNLLLTAAGTVIMAVMLVLYASIIPAERAKPIIPSVSQWFTQLPVLPALLVFLLIALHLINMILRERSRRKTAITASSIKESIDHLQTGLCFSRPNGLVILSNFRMNALSHAIFGKALQNAALYWQALCNQDPVPGVTRLTDGDQPEFCLPDGTVWSFKKEKLNGVIQLTAADTTRQHRLLDELQEKNRELAAMEQRIRSYGNKVDAYVIARERLETRINLHSFFGQALLTTRHHLLTQAGDPDRIIDTWQRNIDILRMEAEPQQKADALISLKNAAETVGMQVHINGSLPDDPRLRNLIAGIGAETLTNAVRHADARQLFIDVHKNDAGYAIRYTNDGRPPVSPIAEGGGLSTARKKAEALGGSLRIETAPRFALTLSLGKEVTAYA